MLAGEEVSAELQDDRVEGAVQVLGQHWAAQLLEEDPAFHRSVPDAQHIVDFFCVKHQEMEPGQREETGGHSRPYRFLPNKFPSGEVTAWKDLQRGGVASSGSIPVLAVGWLHPMELTVVGMRVRGCGFCVCRHGHTPSLLLTRHSHQTKLPSITPYNSRLRGGKKECDSFKKSRMLVR